MTLDDTVFWMQQALIMVLLLCGPPLIAALVTGFLVSLLQAVTQIHEMTLVFIPKIVVVLLVLWLFGDWMLQHAVGFGTRCVVATGDIR